MRSKTNNPASMRCEKTPPARPRFRLKSCENKIFFISKEAYRVSGTIRNYVELYDLTDDESITKMDPMPLFNVDNRCLYLIIKWAEEHKKCPEWDDQDWWTNKKDSKMVLWEKKFFENLEEVTLYELFKAANYMDVKSLLDGCAETVAAMGRGKDCDEMRRVWKLKNDFGDEYDKILHEEPWDPLTWKEELRELRERRKRGF